MSELLTEDLTKAKLKELHADTERDAVRRTLEKIRASHQEKAAVLPRKNADFIRYLRIPYRG